MNSTQEYSKKIPKFKNDDELMVWLQGFKEALHQDFNFVWVFESLMKKLGLSIYEWCTLYMIYVLTEGSKANVALSRAKLATILGMSIHTINKHIAKLKKMNFEYDNKFGFVEKKPLIEGIKKTKYYHENGELIEKEGKTYTPGVSSEIVIVNKGFVQAIKDFLITMHNGQYVNRVKLIPALTKIPLLEGGKCLNLHQLYRLECINAKQKMTKEGIANKSEIARDYKFSRQNFYTTFFKNEVRGTFIDDFRYRSEKGFEKDKSLMKVAPKYHEEVEFFYGQRAVFLPHKKAEKQNPKSAIIMQLWAAHASAKEVSLSKSNEISYTVMNVVKNSLGFLQGKVFKEKIESCMGIFNNFADRNEKYFDKIKDYSLFESQLLNCIDPSMTAKMKADNDYIIGFDQSPNQDFNLFSAVYNDLDNNIVAFIQNYKNRVEAALPNL